MANPDRAHALLRLGRVGRAHGLSGEIKAIPETDDPKQFEALSLLYVGQTPETARPANVQGVRYQYTRKGMLAILKLETVASREAAEALRGAVLYAPAEDLPDRPENAFSPDDLIGHAVVEEHGDWIGSVEDVLSFPSHDMLVIAREEQPSAMVPAVPEFVIDIDPEAKRITLRAIEGLLDA